MKKIVLFIFSIFCSASFLFAAGFSAQVVSYSGKAEVLSGGTWKSLSVGDNLTNGDVIQTGFKSYITLKIKESTVNVEPLTRVTVENLSENSKKDNVRLFVNAGGVSSNVKKDGIKKVGFTVRTPVATASVRGTEFSVQNNFDSSKVETKRGSVAVWNGKNSVDVADISDYSEENSDSVANINDDSFENAPHGALFVKQGQETSVNSGNAVSLRNEAASSVYSMVSVTNSDAVSVSSSLLVNGTVSGDSGATLVVTPETKGADSASLTVTVEAK